VCRRIDPLFPEIKKPPVEFADITDQHHYDVDLNRRLTDGYEFDYRGVPPAYQLTVNTKTKQVFDRVY
jgi:hypothetical protein